MAYVMWGPFANETDKLPLFLLEDADKTIILSRAQSRKATLKKDTIERESDRSANRGFQLIRELIFRH